MTEAVTETKTPERYAHYKVVRPIGRGGMAMVHAATNERTGADVALKVVHEGAYTDEARARFEHEASIAGKLEHPNIVRVYDFLTDESGASVLVMERLRGETVASLLERRGRLSVTETLAIVLPVLEALEHTHKQGIVHRDVKPSNVFLARGAEGKVIPKLLDFGIATRPLSSPHLTADDEVLGTPRSMSPEQIRGDAILDGRSDLFSVASLVIEMLTGNAPFAAKTAAASLVAVLERDVDPAPEIPPKLFVELDRALRKRAIERHASAKDFAEALRTACEAVKAEDLETALRDIAPEDTTAGPLSQSTEAPVERRKRPILPRRVLLPAGAALVLVTVVAFSVGSRFGGRDGGERAAAETSASATTPASANALVLPPNRVPPPPADTPPEPAPTATAAPSPVAAKSQPTSAPKGTAGASAKPTTKPKPTKPVATRPDF
jgi:serine/threonine protein kinase